MAVRLDGALHGGGTGGYNCLVGFAEAEGEPTYGLVVLTNAAPGPNMISNDIAVKLMRVLNDN